MEIWLNNGNDKIRFPVLPSSFKIGTSQNNTSENVHRKGEINLLGERNLETVELSSFFPAQEYDFCQYKGFNTNPYTYINKIKDWKQNKITPTLVITGRADFNKYISIESLEYGEEDGSGDAAFTISLKEYITISYSETKKKTSGGKKVKKKSGKKRKSKSKKTIKYTVRSGDTLKKIAKSKTGKSANASKIYAKNKSVIEKAAKKHGRRSSSKGRYIYQGTKLVITV